jgi:hypothetical protein
MESQVLDNFFTTESLLSLQGAAAAALLIPNVLVYLIPSLGNQVRKWISFTISMLLAYLVAILAPDPGFVKWVLAFFNGFLIFASAMGINEAVSPGAHAGVGGKQFFASWL